MDRIDAMKVLVSAVDEGSLAGAGRRLRKSPAAVSRAIAFLETHVGAELLHRTTRSLKLSEAGERYVAACRRVLVDLEEADIVAGSERSAPRGTLTLTAPIITGEDILRSILDAFMNEYQAVSARLYLLDRPVNLIDEGIDVALRIAHLADSNFVAVRVGEVRRIVAASPGYLARHPVIREPADLSKHQIIAMTHFGLDSWSFPPAKGRPFRESSSSRRGWSSTRFERRSTRRWRGTGSRGCFPITSPMKSGKDVCKSCSARTNTRRCLRICWSRKAACRCRKCAPSSILPRPASSATSRG
jgi:DNA-binding transcriptional LysR family regulator